MSHGLVGDTENIDHGAVAGLSLDAHTQYLHINGQRELSDTWDVGSFPVKASRFISDDTSAAPFVVASTTRVSNLNAGLLDGELGAAFVNSDNISSGNLAWPRLPGSDTGKWVGNPTINDSTVVTGNLSVSGATDLQGVHIRFDSGLHLQSGAAVSGTINVAGSVFVINRGEAAATTDVFENPDTGQIIMIWNSNTTNTTHNWTVSPVSLVLENFEGAILRYTGVSWTIVGRNT